MSQFDWLKINYTLSQLLKNLIQLSATFIGWKLIKEKKGDLNFTFRVYYKMLLLLLYMNQLADVVEAFYIFFKEKLKVFTISPQESC